ncbi:hypothetical protein BDZ89DRAFT_1146926 [Hymenopellis radicata]|nr:hypothetical protein BDZ89DRAFT_1146926 [Hymenopellis radicata]
MNAQRHQEWVSTDFTQRPIRSSNRRASCNVLHTSTAVTLLCVSLLLIFTVKLTLPVSTVLEQSLPNSWFPARPPLAAHRRDFAEITTGAQVVMALTSPSISADRVGWIRHIALSFISGRNYHASVQEASAGNVFSRAR